MSRLHVFIVFALLFFLTTYFSGGSVGVSSQYVDNNYFVTAAASPLSIILGLIFGLFVVFYRRKVTDPENTLTVGIWRRFGAFHIDFSTIIIVVAPLLTLPVILTEYYQTGTFAWSFQRNFSRPSDNAMILPTVFFLFFILFFYFYKHQIVGRPTLGQYVFGYKVVGINGAITRGHAIKRVFLSFTGLCIWPISVIHALSNKKIFWWDKSSNTRVKRVKAVNKPS